MFRRGVLGRHLLDTDTYFFDPEYQEISNGEPMNVRVIGTESIRGIYVSCSLDNLSEITTSLRKVSQLADVHDLTTERTKIIGALHPHQKLYQAIASVDPNQIVPRELSEKEIPEGKYAVITTVGPVERTFAAMREFAGKWLPESGYRVADISVFEIFSANPAVKRYEEIQRDVHIRIEPAE